MKLTAIIIIAFLAGFAFSHYFFPSRLTVVQEDSGATHLKSPTAATPAMSAMSTLPVVGANHVVDAASPQASDARISPEKKRILEDLTVEDIETWKELRRSQAEAFVRNNKEYWQAGYESEKTGNTGHLDMAVLQDGIGKYSGSMNYEIHDLGKSNAYAFGLALNSFKDKAKNKLSMKSTDDSSAMSADFTYQFLGTDGQDINVVWQNFKGNEIPYISYFAFKFRAGMSGGEKITAPLMGLNRANSWVSIGSIELTKQR